MLNVSSRILRGLTAFALVWSCSPALGADPAPPMAYRWCWSNGADCVSSAPATASAGRFLELLYSVNADVNHLPSGIALAGEPWRVISDRSDAPGVCTDFAVTKLHRLALAGVPRGAMSLAYLHIDGAPARMNHLVLLVRTDRGIYVLDNLTDELWRVEQEWRYHWVSRQEFGEPQVWRAM